MKDKHAYNSKFLYISAFTSACILLQTFVALLNQFSYNKKIDTALYFALDQMPPKIIGINCQL